MLVEQAVILPFSPEKYSVPARMYAGFYETLFTHTPKLLPTAFYTANDGEVIATTMKPPLKHRLPLDGYSVSDILQEVKAYQEPFESEPRRDAWVTIYTGPQPPKQVGERVPEMSPAI
jgi:hypothetical protein